MDDSHPADIVRGYLAATIIRLLRFTQKEAWLNATEAETERNIIAIRLPVMQ